VIFYNVVHFLVGDKTSPDESGTVTSGNQVPETVMRSDQPTFTLEQNRNISRDMKKVLTYKTSSTKYGSRSIVLVTPPQVMLVLGYSMLIYYVCVPRRCDMQPMNSPRLFVKCDRITFSIVQEWKYDRRYKKGFDYQMNSMKLG